MIRVRPDGTELEEYVHGLRNICDVAIDPFMSVYTRGNTNDGGGWNIRFIHEIRNQRAIPATNTNIRHCWCKLGGN